MNVKPKVRIKEQQMSIDIFLDKILLELIDHFFLLYSNQDVNSKRFRTRRYYLPKWIIKNSNVIIVEKTFMINQWILL